MDDHPHPEIIIIKRRSNHEEEHHGGAWKIAFADFMTAMMAFFLVLWIINATDKKTKTMIAHYFNPVKLEDAARSPKSIHGDEASAAVDVAGAKQSKARPAPRGRRTPRRRAATRRPRPKAAACRRARAPTARAARKQRFGRKGGPGEPKAHNVRGRAVRRPLSQSRRHRRPYVAGRARHRAERRREERDRDGIGESGRSSRSVPSDRTRSRDGRARRGRERTPADPERRFAAAGRRTPSRRPPRRLRAAPAASEAQQPLAATAARLQKELELQVGALGTSRLGPAIDVKATDEGLLISLTDRLNFSMFAIGSAEPQRQVVQAMEAVARILKDRPGMIVVRGHTDGHPYKSATYDNWRLSSARAQLTYYMLARAGVPESRFERIEGYADRRLRDPSHPFAAENRRIEILLREPKP